MRQRYGDPSRSPVHARSSSHGPPREAPLLPGPTPSSRLPAGPVPTPRPLVQHSLRRVDANAAFGEIDLEYYLGAIRQDDAAFTRPDVEDEPLRELVHFAHLAEGGARLQLDAHADEVVQVDLVLARRLELVVRNEQVPVAPELGLVAVRDAREADDPSALEARGVRDRQLPRALGDAPGRRPGE